MTARFATGIVYNLLAGVIQSINSLPDSLGV